MKRYRWILLALAAAAVLAGGVWFNATFTVMATLTGGEYLILRSEQAQECKESGGCAVFSSREFLRATARLLRAYREPKERS